MPRSGDDARRRLREAALELYRDQGYDATTTAAIAEHAGVTERTYFRHFADKREVLFDGETELREVMVEAIEHAPPTTAPLALVLAAYSAAIPLFVKGRPVAQRRAAIIATAPALQERAHAKSAALGDAIVAALTARGIAPPSSRLATQIGTAVFQRAIQDWYVDPTLDLGRLLAKATDEARAL